MSLRPLGMVVLAAIGPISARAQTAGQLERVERQRFAAQVAGDTTALRNLLGDDLVYVHSNALVETKDQFIATVATGTIRYDALSLERVRHRVYSSTAVGNGRVTGQVRMNGQTIPIDLLFTTVFVKRQGRWRLVSWQSTRAQ